MPGIYGWYPVHRKPGDPWPPVDERCIAGPDHRPTTEAPPDFGMDQAWRWGRLDIMFPSYETSGTTWPKES